MKKLLPALFLVACGIPGDKLLTDVTADGQWAKICPRAVKDSTDRTVDCDGTEIELKASTEADCLAAGELYTNEACEGTFDDWVECADFDPSDEEICGSLTGTPIEYPAGCTKVATCIAVSTPTM